MTRAQDLLLRIESDQVDEGLKDVLKKALLAAVGLSSFAAPVKAANAFTPQDITKAQTILDRGQSSLEVAHDSRSIEKLKNSEYQETIRFRDPKTGEVLTMYMPGLRDNDQFFKHMQLLPSKADLKSPELNALITIYKDAGAQVGSSTTGSATTSPGLS